MLKQKKGKKIRKRIEKRKKCEMNRKIRMFGVNAAGINSKLESFDDILTRLQPQIWAIQETKLKPNEKLKCKAAKKFKYFICTERTLMEEAWQLVLTMT